MSADEIIDNIPYEKTIEMLSLLEKSEEKLDQQGRENATAAFNLGCTVGLIPALVIVLVALFLTRYSWLATVTVAVLMLIALVGFANLAALLARSRTMERIYRTEITPEIDDLLRENELTPEQFYEFAAANLPSTAYLRQFLPLPKPAETTTKRRFRLRIKNDSP